MNSLRKSDDNQGEIQRANDSLTTPLADNHITDDQQVRCRGSITYEDFLELTKECEKKMKQNESFSKKSLPLLVVAGLLTVLFAIQLFGYFTCDADAQVKIIIAYLCSTVILCGGSLFF